MTGFDIVVPTIGRPHLHALFESLERCSGPLPERLYVVDDRRIPDAPLAIPRGGKLAERTVVLKGSARGPASARNIGWRESTAPWIAFLDDDVMVGATWLHDLAADLNRLGEDVAGSQGVISVPLPNDRRPTDWERSVYGLAHARFITADMAYRRTALQEAGGFDERFRFAYREDCDLALRVMDRGYTIVQGARQSVHPVREADRWISLRLQRGNADDALMTALHGANWYERAGAPRGRYRMHVATVASAVAAFAALTLRKRPAAAAAGATWAALTAEFAWKRIAPGPKTREEVGAMLATSALIPFAAVYHRTRGVRAARNGA